MSLPTPVRVHSIKNFKYGTDDYGTIKTVDHSRESTALTDIGDADLDEVVVGRGSRRNRFSITLSDPLQAVAISSHAAAAITFNGLNAADGSAVLVTLTNALVEGDSARHGTRTVAGFTLSGRCDSISMVTPP